MKSELSGDHGRCFRSHGRVQIFLGIDEDQIARFCKFYAGHTAELDRRISHQVNFQVFRNLPQRPRHEHLYSSTTNGKKALRDYNANVERRVFWMVFIVLGLIADIALPLWWALVATIPIVMAAWWVAYRSDWF
jgi:hypothetical protein